MNYFLTFEIFDEKQKDAFADIRDWQTNFKYLQCAAHRKSPRLNLSVSKKGSSVSINACCDDFFRKILRKKSLALRS
jgi:hypothetical protein